MQTIDTPVIELTSRELGSLLGRKSEKVDKPCLECKAVMKGVTIRREFCSPKCRQKNWLRRLNNLKPGEAMEHFNGPRRHERRRTAIPA